MRGFTEDSSDRRRREEVVECDRHGMKSCGYSGADVPYHKGPDTAFLQQRLHRMHLQQPHHPHSQIHTGHHLRHDLGYEQLHPHHPINYQGINLQQPYFDEMSPRRFSDFLATPNLMPQLPESFFDMQFSPVQQSMASPQNEASTQSKMVSNVRYTGKSQERTHCSDAESCPEDMNPEDEDIDRYKEIYHQVFARHSRTPSEARTPTEHTHTEHTRGTSQPQTTTSSSASHTRSSLSSTSTSSFSEEAEDWKVNFRSTLNEMAGNLKKFGGIHCNQAGPDSTEVQLKLNLPVPMQYMDQLDFAAKQGFSQLDIAKQGFNTAVATLSPKKCNMQYGYSQLDEQVFDMEQRFVGTVNELRGNVMPVYKSLFESQSDETSDDIDTCDESNEDEEDSTYEDPRFLARVSRDPSGDIGTKKSNSRKAPNLAVSDTKTKESPILGRVPSHIVITDSPSDFSSADSWKLSATIGTSSKAVAKKPEQHTVLHGDGGRDLGKQPYSLGSPQNKQTTEEFRNTTWIPATRAALTQIEEEGFTDPERKLRITQPVNSEWKKKLEESKVETKTKPETNRYDGEIPLIIDLDLKNDSCVDIVETYSEITSDVIDDSKMIKVNLEVTSKIDESQVGNDIMRVGHQLVTRSKQGESTELIPVDEELEVPMDEEPRIHMVDKLKMSTDKPKIPIDEELELITGEYIHGPMDENLGDSIREDSQIPMDEDPQAPMDEKLEVSMGAYPQKCTDSKPYISTEEDLQVPLDEKLKISLPKDPQLPMDQKLKVSLGEYHQSPMDEKKIKISLGQDPQAPMNEKREVLTGADPVVPMDENLKILTDLHPESLMDQKFEVSTGEAPQIPMNGELEVSKGEEPQSTMEKKSMVSMREEPQSPMDKKLEVSMGESPHVTKDKKLDVSFGNEPQLPIEESLNPMVRDPQVLMDEDRELSTGEKSLVPMDEDHELPIDRVPEMPIGEQPEAVMWSNGNRVAHNSIRLDEPVAEHNESKEMDRGHMSSTVGQQHPTSPSFGHQSKVPVEPDEILPSRIPIRTEGIQLSERLDVETKPRGHASEAIANESQGLHEDLSHGSYLDNVSVSQKDKAMGQKHADRSSFGAADVQKDKLIDLVDQEVIVKEIQKPGSNDATASPACNLEEQHLKAVIPPNVNFCDAIPQVSDRLGNKVSQDYVRSVLNEAASSVGRNESAVPNTSIKDDPQRFDHVVRKKHVTIIGEDAPEDELLLKTFDACTEQEAPIFEVSNQTNEATDSLKLCLSGSTMNPSVDKASGIPATLRRDLINSSNLFEVRPAQSEHSFRSAKQDMVSMCSQVKIAGVGSNIVSGSVQEDRLVSNESATIGVGMSSKRDTTWDNRSQDPESVDIVQKKKLEVDLVVSNSSLTQIPRHDEILANEKSIHHFPKAALNEITSKQRVVSSGIRSALSAEDDCGELAFGKKGHDEVENCVNNDSIKPQIKGTEESLPSHENLWKSSQGNCELPPSNVYGARSSSEILDIKGDKESNEKPIQVQTAARNRDSLYQVQGFAEYCKIMSSVDTSLFQEQKHSSSYRVAKKNVSVDKEEGANSSSQKKPWIAIHPGGKDESGIDDTNKQSNAKNLQGKQYAMNARDNNVNTSYSDTKSEDSDSHAENQEYLGVFLGGSDTEESSSIDFIQDDDNEHSDESESEPEPEFRSSSSEEQSDILTNNTSSYSSEEKDIVRDLKVVDAGTEHDKHISATRRFRNQIDIDAEEVEIRYLSEHTRNTIALVSSSTTVATSDTESRTTVTMDEALQLRFTQSSRPQSIEASIGGSSKSIPSVHSMDTHLTTPLTTSFTTDTPMAGASTLSSVPTLDYESVISGQHSNTQKHFSHDSTSLKNQGQGVRKNKPPTESLAISVMSHYNYSNSIKEETQQGDFTGFFLLTYRLVMCTFFFFFEWGKFLLGMMKRRQRTTIECPPRLGLSQLEQIVRREEIQDRSMDSLIQRWNANTPSIISRPQRQPYLHHPVDQEEHQTITITMSPPLPYQQLAQRERLVSEDEDEIGTCVVRSILPENHNPRIIGQSALWNAVSGLHGPVSNGNLRSPYPKISIRRKVQMKEDLNWL